MKIVKCVKVIVPGLSSIIRIILGYTVLEVMLFWGSRSMVKATRRINAHTVNAQYLPNVKAYEVKTWYTDGARRPVSATSAVTSKVKGKGRKVT